MKNCNECKFINITEEEQVNNKRVYHICQRFIKRVFHKSNNPRIKHSFIYPCKECNGKEFKQR